MIGWLKDKMLTKLVDKATVDIDPRTIWLIIAVLAVVIWLFSESTTEDPQEEPEGGLPDAEADK